MATTKELNSKPSSVAGKDELQPRHALRQEDVEKQSVHDDGASKTAADEQSQKDPDIVDWEGPNDPENPMNWSSAQKITAIGLVSLITFLSYAVLSLLSYLN